MIDIYQIVADSSPDDAVELIKKFGYNIKNADNTVGIANCLKQLVAVEGEPAFREIAALHPDKDVLVELFAPIKETAPTAEKKCNCNKKETTATESYINAAQTNNQAQVHQSNLLIMGLVLIISIAIIVKN